MFEEEREMSWRDFCHGGPIVAQQHLQPNGEWLHFHMDALDICERTHTGGAPLVLTVDTNYLRDTSELAKVVSWYLSDTDGVEDIYLPYPYVLMER